jgi:hypothetical protein
VTRPRGYLLLSLHGEAYADRLPRADQERFRRGKLIVRNPELAGTPDQYALCGAYHPPMYVRNGWPTVSRSWRIARGA